MAEREPRPALALVRFVHRGVRAARLVEALLCTAAGFAATAGAAVLSGARPFERDAVWVALAGGLACGASWWLAYRAGPLSIAREVDRRLRLAGALATAYECELRGSRAPLEVLLSRRVAATPRRAALRSVAPPAALPIAAPFLAFAAFAAARDAVSFRPTATDVAPLVAGLEGELARLPLEAADGETERALVLLGRDARALAAALESAPDAEAAREELERFEEELAQVARQLEPASAPARTLERAHTWLDAARMRLEPPAPPGQAPAAEDATGAAGAEGGAGEGEAPGTLPGALPVPWTGAERPAAADVSLVEPPAPERAGGVGSWWPARHAGVVAGWLEARREALGRAE